MGVCMRKCESCGQLLTLGKRAVLDLAEHRIGVDGDAAQELNASQNKDIILTTGLPAT